MLQWVRTPQQARTREGLTRLLDAAEALVASKGFDDAGIAEIARAAGSLQHTRVTGLSGCIAAIDDGNSIRCELKFLSRCDPVYILEISDCLNDNALGVPSLGRDMISSKRDRLAVLWVD